MTARASALALLVALNAAGAQSTREVRLDAGAAQIQQTGRATHDVAGVFGFSWREGTPLFATLLSAAVTQTGDSATAAQAGLAAAWRATDRSAWQTEGGITVAAFGASILSRGGSFSGFLRERLALDAGGVWAGAAYGGALAGGVLVPIGGGCRFRRWPAHESDVRARRGNRRAQGHDQGRDPVPGRETVDPQDRDLRVPDVLRGAPGGGPGAAPAGVSRTW